jgi:hypothetical protein
MDELTARQRLTRILQGDLLDDETRNDVSAVVEDHLAAIRSKSGGNWDRIVGAEYINDLEQSLEIENQEVLEEDDEDYDDR